MVRLFNIISVLIILTILLFPCCVQATTINMNLTNTAENTNSETTTTSNNIAHSNDTRTIPQSTVISNLNSLPEANLGLSNILSIILIVIGILLILFAIAILIRLKN